MNVIKNKKKKFFLILFSFLFACVFGQSAYESANKNMAVRCLKLAENCLINGDWNNALRQAELGLSYDESISDLIYIKAAALIQLNEKKADVIVLIKKAFDCDNWVNYKKNGARILYADLLCDTGEYDLSLQVLDSEPLIYSADAEFIRIKNLYRIGSEQAIESARLKMNSAIRIYPADVRFANLFFMFETLFMQKAAIRGEKYEIPQLVQTIANYYISKLPDYDGKNLELELLASFFASKENQTRLVRAIDSKDQTVYPLMAVAGLQTGLYSQQQACDLFFKTVGDSFLLSDLEYFSLFIDEPQVSQNLIEKMLNFKGTVFIDSDLDLQNELVVEFSTGRPVSSYYDANNDDYIEVYAVCDFGSPKTVEFLQNNCKVSYDSFPVISQIEYDVSDKNIVLKFFGDDFSFTPFIMEENHVLGKFGLEFYLPVISKELNPPVYEDMYNNAISLEININERENAKVIYTLLKGKKISAVFLQNDKSYAFCNFSDMPFVRAVDSDEDGYFETSELYDLVNEETFPDGFDSEFISNIFGQSVLNEKIYLKQIKIDRNANSFFEFSEEYLPDNGKICYWDNDDNGILDCKHTIFGKKDGEPLKEESEFYDENGNVLITISFVNKIPIKMMEKESEVLIFAGENENVYWVENLFGADIENKIINSVKNNIAQGAVDVCEIDGMRFSVIKVEDNYFCKALAESGVSIEE